MKEDPTCGNLTDSPNEYYAKFFSKFNEIDTLEISSWKPVHILAYFCKKYNDAFKCDYKFKFNTTSPSKCFEIFQIKKLSSMLTADPALLKSYIDWAFSKVKGKKYSISFITNEKLVNEYKIKVLMSNKPIDRTSTLPEKYVNVFLNIGINLKTYGDLAFLSKTPNPSPQIISALSAIKDIGFDMSLLNKIV